MYVMRVHKEDYTSQLFEMSKAELREALEADKQPDTRWRHRRVWAQEAHAWVKSGGLHSTGLWVDSDRRIRYAKSAPDC